MSFLTTVPTPVLGLIYGYKLNMEIADTAKRLSVLLDKHWWERRDFEYCFDRDVENISPLRPPRNGCSRILEYERDRPMCQLNLSYRVWCKRKHRLLLRFFSFDR